MSRHPGGRQGGFPAPMGDAGCRSWHFACHQVRSVFLDSVWSPRPTEDTRRERGEDTARALRGLPSKNFGGWRLLHGLSRPMFHPRFRLRSLWWFILLGLIRPLLHPISVWSVPRWAVLHGSIGPMFHRNLLGNGLKQDSDETRTCRPSDARPRFGPVWVQRVGSSLIGMRRNLSQFAATAKPS